MFSNVSVCSKWSCTVSCQGGHSQDGPFVSVNFFEGAPYNYFKDQTLISHLKGNVA